MTRSIFDPGSGETERSGATFRPRDAEHRSNMPPDVVDGEVTKEEEREAEAVAEAQAAGLTPAERIDAIPPDEVRENPTQERNPAE